MYGENRYGGENTGTLDRILRLVRVERQSRGDGKAIREVYRNGRWTLTVRRRFNQNGVDTGMVLVDLCYDKVCVSGVRPEELDRLIATLMRYVVSSKIVL